MAKINRATVLAVVCACLASATRVPAQSPVPAVVRPLDVFGWGKTRWGMTEGEVKHVVHARWRPATKEEREDDRDVYMPLVLQDVRIGQRKFIGLFGFSKEDRRLVMVTIHSGIPFIRTGEAAALFESLADKLQGELGTAAKIVRNNSGHTGFYADYALWRFPSSVIELTCIRPNDAERAVVLFYALPSEADRWHRAR